MQNDLEFANLIINNPELPVVCAVDGDVCCDDSCCRWLASIGYCYIGEYVCYNDHYYTDREEFMDVYYEYNEDDLCEKFGYRPIMTLPDAYKQYKEEDIEKNNIAEENLNKYLKEIADRAFRMAIIANINVPDDDMMEEFES